MGKFLKTFTAETAETYCWLATEARRARRSKPWSASINSKTLN